MLTFTRRRKLGGDALCAVQWAEEKEALGLIPVP